MILLSYEQVVSAVGSGAELPVAALAYGLVARRVWHRVCQPQPTEAMEMPTARQALLRLRGNVRVRVRGRPEGLGPGMGKPPGDLEVPAATPTSSHTLTLRGSRNLSLMIRGSTCLFSP